MDKKITDLIEEVVDQVLGSTVHVEYMQGALILVEGEFNLKAYIPLPYSEPVSIEWLHGMLYYAIELIHQQIEEDHRRIHGTVADF